MMKKILFMLICAPSVLLGVYAYEYLLWTKEYKYNVEGSFNEALRLRAQGEDVVPLLFPHLYISKNSGSPFLPLSAPSRANMVGVNESGFWPRLLTDEFGFNNLPDAHQANPDILLIGDSLTQGMNVESFDNLAGQLAKKGRRVINLGQAGSGPLTELAILRAYGLRLHPRHVVWLFCSWNDFVDLEFERTVPGLSHLSVSKNETLAERRDKTDKLWSTFLSSLIIQAPGVRTTDTLRFMRAARTRTVLRSRLSQREEAPVSDELISLLASIVATARAESEAVGSAFTFVYLPPPLGFSAVDNGVLRKDWESMNRILVASKISVMDFSLNVQRSPDPSLLWARTAGGPYSGTHYSVAGYALLAESIAAEFSKRMSELQGAGGIRH